MVVSGEALACSHALVDPKQRSVPFALRLARNRERVFSGSKQFHRRDRNDSSRQRLWNYEAEASRENRRGF